MKKLGFGLMRLPLTDAGDPRRIDIPQMEKMVDAFLERGFSYFDTAYMYHNFASERAVKKVIVDRYPRDSFTLTSKLPMSFLGTEPEEQERIFSEQLDKCGVEYFDYYLLHNLGEENYRKAQAMDSFGFIARKKAEGRVRYTGFSYHDSAKLLDEILTAHPEVDVVQIQLNYLDWENEGIQSRKCLETAVKHGKPVIVMEPVKGGTLASLPQEAESLMKSYAPNASLPSWAIRFAASKTGVMMVLSGMSDLEQLLDNTGYMRDFTPLNDEENGLVLRVREILKKSPAIACTACRYCVEGCPSHIPIPDYFALYNADKEALNKDFSPQSAYYDNLTKTNGKASSCTECGQCEKSCPQHLPIRELMKKVAMNFE